MKERFAASAIARPAFGFVNKESPRGQNDDDRQKVLSKIVVVLELSQ
jgi:hypothetical protein